MPFMRYLLNQRQSAYTVQPTHSSGSGNQHHFLRLHLPRSVRRAKRGHRYIDYTVRSATLAYTGIFCTLRNARCSYLALRFPSKRRTNRPHHIDYIRKLSTASPGGRFRAHRANHRPLLNLSPRGLDMPECSGWCRWIDSLHSHH